MTNLLLEAGSFFKILQVLLVSAIKFFIAPPISNVYGFDYIQTVITTTAGGIFGVVFFYYLSSMLIRLFKMISPYISHSFRPIIREIAELFPPSKEKKKKRIFTWKNRLIIKTRKRFGLIGIALLTPILLSIPLGSFLTAKYYSRQKYALLYLSMSIVFWSFFISSIVFFKGFNPIK